MRLAGAAALLIVVALGASWVTIVHLARLNKARMDFPVVLTLVTAVRSRRIALAEDLRSGSSGTSSAPQAHVLGAGGDRDSRATG